MVVIVTVLGTAQNMQHVIVVTQVCKFYREFINQIQTEWVCYNCFVSIVHERIKGALYSRRVVVLAIL